MGSQANFFIEVRDDSGKWNKLKGYYPFKKRTYKEYDMVNAIWYDKDTEPDLNVGENGFTELHKIWRQGDIRDMFSRSQFNDADFANRGLPDDLSEEVKAWFDNELAKQAEKDRLYEEKFGSKPWGSGKWWWGESYATLSELESYFDKKRSEWEKNLRGEFKKVKKITEYKELFSAINDLLKSTGAKERKKRDRGLTNEDLEGAEEMIDYYLEEEIFDVFNLWSFINTIDTIVECLSDEYVSSNNVRVICYCS